MTVWQSRDGLFISIIPFYKKYHFQKNEHVSTVMLGEKFWQLEIILLAETKKNGGTGL